MGPLRLVDLRNVLDATVDTAVAGLNELAASLPRQNDQERCADRMCAPEQPCKLLTCASSSPALR